VAGEFLTGVKRRWWLIALGLAWVLMGGLTYIQAMTAYGDPFQAEQLARAGSQTHAAITDVAKGTGHDGKPVWQIRYEFLDVTTRKRTGAIVISDEAAVKRFEKQGAATVRYLQSNPEVSTIEGHRRPALSMEAAFGLWSLVMLGCLPLGLTLALAARDAWRARAGAV
jgi:hypothetical protein